jgi:hypothetical protein
MCLPLATGGRFMKQDRKINSSDSDDGDSHDRDPTIRRAMARLMVENRRLKKLVVQLSETVIRNVVRKP